MILLLYANHGQEIAQISNLEEETHFIIQKRKNPTTTTNQPTNQKIPNQCWKDMWPAAGEQWLSPLFFEEAPSGVLHPWLGLPAQGSRGAAGGQRRLLVEDQISRG